MRKKLNLRVALLMTVTIIFTSISIPYAQNTQPLRLDVPNFTENAAPWGEQKLGFSENIIGMTGCALTSLSMVLKYYGANTNPGALNEWMKSNNGFLGKNAIVWTKAAELVPGLYVAYNKTFSNGADLTLIKSEIDQGYPVIAQMNYKGTNHYAVICGYDGDTFYMNDPWYEDPSHTLNRVVQWGFGPVAYDNYDNASLAIKSIVVYKTQSPTPPKVRVIEIKSSYPESKEALLQPIKMPTIELFIDDPTMIVNGKKKKIDAENDVKPIIIDGRTMMPISAIIKEMSGTAEWDGDTRKVTLKVQGRVLETWIGRRTYFINTWKGLYDTDPLVLNGRTLLPVGIISDKLGCKVTWDGELRKVTISQK